MNHIVRCLFMKKNLMPINKCHGATTSVGRLGTVCKSRDGRPTLAGHRRSVVSIVDLRKNHANEKSTATTCRLTRAATPNENALPKRYNNSRGKFRIWEGGSPQSLGRKSLSGVGPRERQQPKKKSGEFVPQKQTIC